MPQTYAKETGVVSRVFEDKMFGFITPDQSNDDHFFHRDGMMNVKDFGKNLKGKKVEFISVHGRKGPRAEDVEVVG